MGRWKPDARSRLERAAIELYGERGFELTTVAEIAKRADLTERTFFRHFADKREVLFSGGAALEEHMVKALERAPKSRSALDAVRAAVEAAAEMLRDRRDFAKLRQSIILKSAELQERERIKLASLANALADALCRRGVAPVAATLAAEMGGAIFRVAFGRWCEDDEHRDLSQIVQDSFEELKTVVSG